MKTIKIDGMNHVLRDVVHYEVLENCLDRTSLDTSELQWLANRALDTEELEDKLEKARENHLSSLEEVRDSISRAMAMLDYGTSEEPLEAFKDLVERFEKITRFIDKMDDELEEFINNDNRPDSFIGVDI